MIFLVPTSPEVPPRHSPRLWQGLLVIFVLGLIYLGTEHVFDADLDYVESLQTIDPDIGLGTGNVNYELLDHYLSQRPLLKIAPSKGDWDLKRLLYANFIHEGPAHLLLNMIGVFAGMRICSTFIPFGCSLAIFILGGSLGLLVSMLLATEPSGFIPHLGSSAGLFALMGTYYVYNFKYRTRYFFWFPSRNGKINLKTSWFFFVDALLLEVILSLAQLFPTRVDSVDHIAHVVGFSSGVVLALLLRSIQRWPKFLQTRQEFLFWAHEIRPNLYGHVTDLAIEKWAEILEVNQYNDQVKFRLNSLVHRRLDELTDEQVELAFRFMSPTFIRLYPQQVAHVLRRILAADRRLPKSWLTATPYDSIIRLAKHLAYPPEEQGLLLNFVTQYRRSHPEGGDLERKLELLTQKLSGLVTSAARPTSKTVAADETTTPRYSLK